VIVRLIAAYNGAYGGFNFNGYGKGQVLVDIPKGWRVRVSCTDNSSSLSHSCAIVRGVGTTALAFPGSASSRAQAGLSPHHSTTFSFVAAHVGRFRIACLVDGHELAGMWDVLDVSHSRLPSVTLLRRLPP
jgi:Sulfocyanin (SoxE) domain